MAPDLHFTAAFLDDVDNLKYTTYMSIMILCSVIDISVCLHYNIGIDI